MVRTVFLRILNLGIDEKTNPSAMKNIRVINTQITLAIACHLSAIPLILYFYQIAKPALFVCLFMIAMMFLVLCLNYNRKLAAACIVGALAAVNNIFWFTILLGTEANIHFLMPAIMIGAFYYFPYSRKKSMFLIMGLSVAAFIFLEIWFLTHSPILVFPTSIMPIVIIYVDSAFCVTVFGFMLYGYLIFHNSEWELNSKNDQLTESNQKIIGSIEYAHRIQSSLLPSPTYVKQLIPQNFIIWHPRDIVGGDVYYIDKFDNGFLMSLIDCTGHGVPGAFMTMLASSSLRRITLDEKCLNPPDILKRLNTMVKASLQQDKDHVSSDDGLDAAVCFVNTTNDTLTFAGARLPLTYIHNGREQTLNGDRHSIGYKKADLNFEFTSHKIKIEDGMAFYLYTDGIIDQLGGEKRMSFGRKRLKKLLLDGYSKSFDQQRGLIIRSFEEYKGKNETQDDISLIGFSV